MFGADRGTLFALFLTALVGACSSEAPQGVGPTGLPAGVDAPSNAHGETPELMAVAYASGCSAALIEVGGPPNAPAYALTAGHCVGTEYWLPNQSSVDLPSDFVRQFSANGFWDTHTIYLPVARVEYQTMHLGDIAVLRLQSSNAEVLAAGVVPLRLAQEPPARGEPISIVGHPNGDSLRRSRCENGVRTYLAEDEFLFRQTGNECAQIAPGSSGSPVLNDANEIFGVLSTGSGSGRPCSLNNPCDLSQAELMNAAVPTSYFSDVARLDGCFVEGRFELDAADCPLAKLTQTFALRRNGHYVQSRADAIGTWDVSLAQSPLPYYRFKVGTAQDTRCDDDRGYGAARTVAAQPKIDEALPAREGLYLLCVEGSRDGHSFDEADAALAFFSEVDNTPPHVPAQSEILFVSNDQKVKAYLGVDQIEQAKFYYRLQLPGETDCALAAADRVATTSIDVSSVPGDPRNELCLTVEDAAGNRSAPGHVSLTALP
jgi:V8-like Glu-specific endopeptidase